MISLAEFKKRRKALQNKLPKDAIAIIPGASEQVRNHDVHYPFRQNSHFLYLTGLSEPDAVLVICGGDDAQVLLFSEPYSVDKEIWTGPLLGSKAAVETLGVDEAYPIDEFSRKLVECMLGRRSVYYPFLQTGPWEKILFQAWKTARGQKREDLYLQAEFVDLSPLLAEARLFKSVAEIACMQKAVDASIEAHLAVMRSIHACEYEYQVRAIFEAHLLQQGITEQAYSPIVASGPNACILHYTQYQRRFKPQEFLLLDAGGEYLGYAADITRTYPVGGYWSLEQQRIYDLVLHAQKQGIGLIRPGIAWQDIQTLVVETLTQGLVDLGILTGSVSGLIEQGAYKSFYMHNSGHWLGLDVHDAGAYKVNQSSRVLEEGMVLTVEPGLYFSPRLTQVDARWLGLGVRIEDDVLVTAHGAHILSGRLPKHIDEIKAVMTYA
jgi:Xaa-Pro aminopeptidase